MNGLPKSCAACEFAQMWAPDYRCAAMRFSAVLGLACLVGVMAAPAPAAHDADDHSPNMEQIASVPMGGLGDIAFWGDRAVVSQFVFENGSTDGFSVVDISEPARPREITRFVCTGAGWDVSIWGDLVFLSVDNFTPTEDGSCASPPGDGFAGIKIVSIADPEHPVQVGSVAMPCSGSHTNTVIPDLDHRRSGAPAPRLVVYASSLRYSTEPGMTGCDAIIEMPIGAPEQAQIVGALPGDELQACHDVTAFLPRKLLAAACASELRLYDIADPAAPRLLSTSVNPSNLGQHSAIFSNDGASLVSGEESLFYTGSASGCPGGTRTPIGALWFYDVSDPAAPLVPRGYHQLERGLEAPLPGGNGCSAHDFNVVPTRSDRDVLVTAWYAGGVSAIDFTDLAAPKEIAHYQPDLSDPARRAFYWSAYWYRGHVYASNGFESERQSFDVYRISDPAIGDTYRLPHLNPQTQEPLSEAPPAPLPAPGSPQSPGRPPAADDRPACRAAPTRLRVRRARRVVRADLLSGRRRVRRLRARGAVVRVDLGRLPAGRYTVRVAYRDRSGRARVLRRRVVAC